MPEEKIEEKVEQPKKNNGIDINSKEYIVVWYDIGLEKLAKFEKVSKK